MAKPSRKSRFLGARNYTVPLLGHSRTVGLLFCKTKSSQKRREFARGELIR